MSHNNAIVLVIDYDPTAVLVKFIGRSPLELLEYMKRLVQPATEQIEMSQPDKYEAAGETHQAIWLKLGRDECELTASVFKLVLNLARELDRINTEATHNGLPPAIFHAGLSEGKVDIDSNRLSGDGLQSAYALTDHARKAGAMLSGSATVLERVRYQSNHRFGLKMSEGNLQRIIDFKKDALLAITNVESCKP